MVVTSWSAWYLSQYWFPWDMTGIDWKVFSKAFHSHWDCENCWRIDGDMAEWSLWQTFCSLPTTVQITSEEREQSDLTYNLQTDCGLTIVGREQSDLMYNLQTDYGLTVVGREHSDLTHNIAHCDADHCWKGAKRPDGQHYLQLHRPLLEESKLITHR